jgi:hypothetical protein
MEEQAIKDFVEATGGGKGEYKPKRNRQRNDDKIFHQLSCSSSIQPCGFGRIKFHATEDDDFKLYLRFPHTSDPKLVLYFMQTVWNLPSPKLIIGITGGAIDFTISPDLEVVLNELMQITRETDAWIITGGTRGGIMKYFGKFFSGMC